MRLAIAITAATLGIGGCSAGADRAAAEAGVVQFHQMIEAQRYHDIYVGAADEFRSAATEAEGVRFLQMITIGWARCDRRRRMAGGSTSPPVERW